MKLRHEYYILHLLFTKTNTYLSHILRSAAIRFQEVMSPGNSNSTMSAFSTNNPDTMTLAVLKLHDDGSNWADYEPCIQRALGLKGLWRHVEGTAIAPKLYVLVAGVPVLMDGTTQATEDQIKAREMKIIDYDMREYLAQHIILSMTSTHLSNKIKNLKTSHDMWDVVKVDATTKSTLFLLNVEDQLASMKLAENDNPKGHFTEVKQHFQLMGQQHNNLLKMGSTISDSRYNTIIMSSLPELYQPTLQTITAVKHASTLLGTSSSRAMKPDDLITFIMEEAQHCIINDKHTKNVESTLTALGKKQRTRKHCSNKGKEKSTPGMTCENCKNTGHTKANCWSKGEGKEGQGPRGWNSKKGEKKAETAAAVEATGNADEIFAFTCTSDYVEVANTLNVPKSWLGACIDSGASQHYSPDHDAFINYSLINNTTITTADGHKLKVLGKGDVRIELPNGAKHTKTILKEAIHAPDMAFTLISVGQLDDVKCSATFSGGMCTIHNPRGHTMATIPCANGLYHVTAPEDPPLSTMQALWWSSWPSAKPTGNLATSHLQLLSMWLQRATLLAFSLTLSQSLNSVRHVPRPKQLGNPSQRNWKLMRQNTECASTGTCGDQPQSEASVETHMWQHA